MYQALLHKVLKNIKPSEKEKKEEVGFTKSLLKTIRRTVPHSVNVILTGSMAKATYLREGKDIDVFILFNRKKPREQFENEIKKIMKKAFPGVHYQLSYAEHPYARFHLHGRRIDLVPAYKIKKASDRRSAVDRSALHTEYVLRNLGTKQREEVLLLKQFLKSAGIYGAEIKVGGFSGYLCELLVIQYGSFMKTIRAAAKWRVPVFIDLLVVYREAEQPAVTKQFGKQLVVIDPTDRHRNVAAAVSAENLKRFTSMSVKFLKKPSLNYFFKKPKTFEQKVKELKRKGYTYLLVLQKPELVDDVLWGQLKKLIKQLESYLEKNGFVICSPGIIADDSEGRISLLFAVKERELSEWQMVAGPPLHMKKHVQSFIKHHKGATFKRKKGRIYALVKRKIRTVECAVKEAFGKFGIASGSYFADHARKTSIRII